MSRPFPMLLLLFGGLLSLTDAECNFPNPHDNNGEITCSAPDAYVCRENLESFGHAYNVTKENEGAFKCCCEETCSCDRTPIVVYAPQTPSPVITNLTVQWGAEANINCPYTPGALINKNNNDYLFNWFFKRDGSNSLLALVGQDVVEDLFEHEKGTDVNTLRIFQFNPLFVGVYRCTLRIEDTPISEMSELNVTMKISPESEVAVTTQPSSVLLPSNNAMIGSATFQCTASITGNEKVGFRLKATDTQSELMNIAEVRDECILDYSNARCTVGDTLLECNYDTPYSVSCNFIVSKLTVSNSTRVECFVMSNDGSFIETSSEADLYIIPETLPSQPSATFSRENNQWTIVQSLDYPIIIEVNVTMVIGDRTHIASQVISNSTDLVATFSSNLNINEMTEVMLVIRFGDINRNYFNITLDPPAISSTPSTSVSMTTIPSSSPTISISTSDMPTSAPAIVIPTVVGVSVGFVVLVLVIVVLIVILVTVTRMSGGNKDESNRNSPSALHGGENGDVIPTGYQMSLLSPNHHHPTDTYSQMSTSDTYIDDHSPRHAPPSYSSRSSHSHSHSSNSCPSTRHLRDDKPLPRYGIPDHYPQYNHPLPYSSLPPGTLGLNSIGIPEISVITPTPTMENHPIMDENHKCLSPTGTEPFSSPNTPSSEDKRDVYFSLPPNRPSDLPISGGVGNESVGSTPLNDQTMIGVLLYLQHKDCNKRDNCQTCKLIDRHFERIANKYGENALSGMMKTLNTPGAEGTLKHLRRREKKTQRIRSPHRATPPSLGVTFKRQRSHSASHIEEDELTFSSTETEDESLKPSHRRVKPMKRRAVTDDEREMNFGYPPHRLLPLQRINEGLSLSQHDIPMTPLDRKGIPHFPGHKLGKNSETDSTDGSTSSRSDSNPRFGSGNGLSASYMKTIDVEESVPPVFLPHAPPHSTYYSSSGYDTDVFVANPTTSSGSEQGSLRGRVSPMHPQTSVDSQSSLRYDNGSLGGSTIMSQKSQHVFQSDYLKATHRKQHHNGSNLSPSSSGAISMHSSPDKYRYGSQVSNGSTSAGSSNHSIHSESAALLPLHPRPHRHNYYSPPQQRKHNNRTPSPLQLLLPSDDSSATPI